MSQIIILPHSVKHLHTFLWLFISFSELSRNLAVSREHSCPKDDLILYFPIPQGQEMQNILFTPQCWKNLSSLQSGVKIPDT